MSGDKDLATKFSRVDRDASSEAKGRLMALFDDLLAHEGFGHLEVSFRILKRGQKEVILRCGKEYRYVIDMPSTERVRASTVSIA